MGQLNPNGRGRTQARKLRRCADGTVPHLVFEFMDYDLYRVLPAETGNEFPMDNIRHYMRQMLEGLFEMHRVRVGSGSTQWVERHERTPALTHGVGGAPLAGHVVDGLRTAAARPPRHQKYGPVCCAGWRCTHR